MNSQLQSDGIAAERAMNVTGSQNLRDMGGYETADGRHVKWRTLYRSGAIANLPAASEASMRALGIVAICDLRTPHERGRRPMTWHEGEEIYYYGAALNVSVGDLERTIAEGRLRPGVMREAIEKIYRKLPIDQKAGYRELFRLLSTGQLPLLFNCAAGKDRTGLAAALVLYALGVPRATIEHDYQLTNLAIEGLERMILGDSRYANLSNFARDDYLPLLMADPSYLEIAFNEIEREFGNIEAYLETVLGAGPNEIEAMRGFLLE